ncbi:PIF1-like helicase domain-containing protein [Ditylenchus destructor]|uniref:PIF1-like helicase domain-containing protein n=1 Tax=Ditylenchus destructor TaxID=166010 RepID=A0AAD4MG97_9BILA|nr:PIF1-like helicase domain-containing protein [Ditylenchus destructor]
MPPKRFKPQVPMETRSRAKAKNNAEIQLEVDAKRIRKDTRPAPGDEGYFEFPEECLSNDLITDVYGSALATKNYDEMHERVILTPLNKDANEICNQVLEFLEGEDKYYTSMDTLAENNHLSNTERYPTEVLYAIQLNEYFGRTAYVSLIMRTVAVTFLTACIVFLRLMLFAVKFLTTVAIFFALSTTIVATTTRSLYSSSSKIVCQKVVCLKAVVLHVHVAAIAGETCCTRHIFIQNPFDFLVNRHE